MLLVDAADAFMECALCRKDIDLGLCARARKTRSARVSVLRCACSLSSADMSQPSLSPYQWELIELVRDAQPRARIVVLNAPRSGEFRRRGTTTALRVAARTVATFQPVLFLYQTWREAREENGSRPVSGSESLGWPSTLPVDPH